ncbi:hypothetical protein WDU94_008692 [Cyamophila willieti]
MWGDTLLIVFISICTALLSEGLTWLMVYRTEKYQKLKTEIEKQSKKLEKKKEKAIEKFDGKIVAKLPFTPISWVQGLSHRNLAGEDHTDCSFIFLYILCTMSIRQNIQKMLGFAPSRTAAKQGGGMFGTQPKP